MGRLALERLLLTKIVFVVEIITNAGYLLELETNLFSHSFLGELGLVRLSTCHFATCLTHVLEGRDRSRDASQAGVFVLSYFFGQRILGSCVEKFASALIET